MGEINIAGMDCLKKSLVEGVQAIVATHMGARTKGARAVGAAAVAQSLKAIKGPIRPFRALQGPEGP